jgi:hypothetical protein
MPAFSDTVGGDFRLSSDADSAVDAAKTDVSGWLTPMWLSVDPRGFVPHDAAMTNFGTGTPSYADIGAYEFDTAPFSPAIVVSAGRYDFVVNWTARGDDGDDGVAGTREVYVNGTSMSSAPALPPGSPTCVQFDWSDCTPIGVQVKVTERDNGQFAWSNVVNTATACSGNRGYACDGQGRPALKPGGASSTVSFGDADGAEPADYPLSLSTVGQNPSKSIGDVAYAVPKALGGSQYELAIFDVAGRQVALLGRGLAVAGRTLEPAQQIADHSGRLASGVYFLRLTVGDKRLTRTVLLVP